MMSKLFTGGVAVSVALAAIPAPASPTRFAASVALATQAVGQASKAKEYERRKEAERLLKTAREALAEGNLETAESYVSRAEALGLTYSKLFLFGDTPQKARRDLEKRKTALGRKSSSEEPAEKAAAPRSRSERTTRTGAKNSDPFGDADSAGDDSETPPPVRRRPEPLSLDGGAEEQFMPNERPVRPARTPAADASADGSSSDAHLIAARRFLAVGDVAQARQRVAQARQLGLEYAAGDDNPDQIETALRDFEDLQARSKTEGGSDAMRRMHATLLVDQAQALLRWKQYDEAERLAEDAARLTSRAPELQARPKQLLTRIAHERRANGQSSEMAGNSPPAASPAAAKTRALRLAAEARLALGQGDLDRAEGLVRQAEALRVPETQFGPGEDRPSSIARAIRTRRGLESSTPAAVNDGLVLPTAGTRAGGADRKVEQLLFDPSKDQTRNAAAQADEVVPGDADPLADDPFSDTAPAEQPPLFGPPDQPAQPLPSQPEPGQALAPPADALSNPAEPPPVDLPATEAPIQTAPPVQLPAAEPQPTESLGLQLFREGEKALKARNIDAALKNFRQANEHRADLDPATLERLDGHLQILSPPVEPTPPPTANSGDLISDAAKRQQLLFKQVSADLARQQTEARNLRENDPKKALELLTQAKAQVTASGLEPQYRDQLLRRLEISVRDTEQYIAANRADIELAEQNQAVLNDVERRQQVRVEVDARLAKLVNDYNELMDEHRYAEAETLAKKANELAPDHPVVKQLLLQSKFVRRLRRNEGILDRKEDSVASTLMDVDQASELTVGDATPLVFDKNWDSLTTSPFRRQQEQRRRRTEKEIQIERKLSSEVSINFRDKPLGEVIDHLAKVTGVPIVLDQLALQEEGVESDALVTIPLDTPISLKSALNLILEPLKLSYIIKDEVLKVTSEQKRDGDLYPRTYNVADLVIPIPNFAPTGRLGLAAALQAGMADAAVTWNGGAYGNLGTGGSNLGFASQGDQALGASGTLAQPAPGPSDRPYMQQPAATGPGGLSGGSQADFDTLIDLIVTTIAPDSWDEVGGPGSISPFPTNLSLVISQTQDVHEQIVDLLEQLRRLQDLQVTIEVRFITLDDNFFERIGVDFDFNIGPAVTQAVLGQNQNANFQPSQSATVGLTNGVGTGPPTFTSDLDLQFRQGSFGSTVPQFGGFDAATAATFGFAILSDIETFFFVQAAQGDTRTNVLQAPKVTLFNGQQASVNDTAQQPFVISVIPVVGDFAAAQQPVIVVLPEGTHLTVQAVVSPDRRFVRMTLVPFFSNIGDVQEFTFTGSQTSADSESTTKNNTDNTTTNSKSANTNRNGTTVQLPTFASISVSTTVSVPDGGTILLGGIKRLREGRTERGVPIMSKLPYVNRLFKNVGIGRETQSLMMMVTPRIIIQEEEEAKLGVTPPPTPPTP
ncbi:MAG: hypothetical protein U0836_23485 [Pirellulales bacterium]